MTNFLFEPLRLVTLQNVLYLQVGEYIKDDDLYESLTLREERFNENLRAGVTILLPSRTSENAMFNVPNRRTNRYKIPMSSKQIHCGGFWDLTQAHLEQKLVIVFLLYRHPNSCPSEKFKFQLGSKRKI